MSNSSSTLRVASVSVLALLGILRTASAQIATDACGYNPGNQYAVNTTCSFRAFDKPASFAANMNPGGCNSGNYDDAYGWFTAISTTTIITYDPNDNQRPVLHVFTGACGSLTQVPGGCMDAGSNGNNANLILQTTVGTSYMVRIQLHNSNSAMNGDLCIWSPNTTNWCSYTPASRIPVGESCVLRPFEKPAIYTNTMPVTPPLSGCTAGNYDDAFGWFTATTTTTLITYDPNDNHRAILHVFTGACGSLTQVGCVNAGANGTNAELLLTTTIGTDYLIRIQRHNDSGEMNGRICVRPTNTTNTCSYAPENQIPVGESCILRSFEKPEAYTNTMNPSGCSASNYDDAFGWFTATTSSSLIIYDPNDNHRAILHVFTGPCGGPLTQVGCVNAGGDGNNAEISISTTIGTNYLVRIQRHNSSGGMNGRICVTSLRNDECANAIDLPVTTACSLQYFSNVGSTRSSTSPDPNCGGSLSSMRDVWFRFVAPGNGPLPVRIFAEAGSLTDGVMQLYTGTCGSLTRLSSGCSDDGGSAPNSYMPYMDRICTPLTRGTTYYIRFFGRGGSVGSFGLCIYEPGFHVQDCAGGQAVCSNNSINNSSNWTGCTVDLNNTNNGCLNLLERQGTWYYFQSDNTGNVAFTITPTNSVGRSVQADYDFAIWGPMDDVVCPPIGHPIRCSYADPNDAGTWLTGLAAGNTDHSEVARGPGVNGFVAPLVISPAEVDKMYIIYVDNWGEGGQSFRLDWTLSNSSMLDCTILPVRFLHVSAQRGPSEVLLTWKVQSIGPTDYFVAEHSDDAIDFSSIATIQADQNGEPVMEYAHVHRTPSIGTNYYRVKQVDPDGSYSYSEVQQVLFMDELSALSIINNPVDHTLLLQAGEHIAASPVPLRVIDTSGRVVMKNMQATPGSMTSISVSSLAAGYYTVLLFNGSGAPIARGRFLKQ